MKFESITNYFDDLVGKKLQAINEATGSLLVLEVKDGSLIRVKNEESKYSSVTFAQLKQIWEELTRKGFANVDQALYGSGSSRNRHETILANLPFIEHFKYKGKKHLLLRNKAVHSSGELQEITGSNLRLIRKQLDEYFSVDRKQILIEHKLVSASLLEAHNVIAKKYPGEVDTLLVKRSLVRLANIEAKLESGLVGLDHSDGPELNNSPDLFDVDSLIDLDKLADDVSFTGVDDGDGSVDENNKNLSMDPQQYDYQRDRLKIRPLTPTISAIFDRMRYEEINLQPDFQRKDRIWPVNKKSKLIESVLMGLPLPAFYFGEEVDEAEKWIVIDGLQRVTTFYDFMRDMFKLTNLDKLDSFNGAVYSELSRDAQRKIREFSLNVYLIEFNRKNQDAVVELFQRINTSGMVLSSQEIRSAVNYGTSVKFLRLIAESSEFRKATHEKVKATRQKDMELCLGAISYILFGYKNHKNPIYTDFLANTMKELNRYPIDLGSEKSPESFENLKMVGNTSEIFLELSFRFKRSLVLVHEVFGELAFRKSSYNVSRQPVNKSLFELLVASFAMLSDEQATKIRNANDEEKILAFALLEIIAEDSTRFAVWDSQSYVDENRGFAYSISQSTGKKVTIIYRFEAFIAFLKETTDVELCMNPLIENYKYQGVNSE